MKRTIATILLLLAFALLAAFSPAHADGALQPALGACVLQQNGNWYKLRYTFTVRGTATAGQLFEGQYLGAWQAHDPQYFWHYRAILPEKVAQKTWTFDTPFWERFKPTMIGSVGGNSAALYSFGAISLPYCAGYEPDGGVVAHPPSDMTQTDSPKSLMGVNICTVQETGNWHQLRYTFIERNETNKVIRHAVFDANLYAADNQGGALRSRNIHVSFPTLNNHTFRQWEYQNLYWSRGDGTDTVPGDYYVTQPDDPPGQRKIGWAEQRTFNEIPFCVDSTMATQGLSTFPVFLPVMSLSQ